MSDKPELLEQQPPQPVVAETAQVPDPETEVREREAQRVMALKLREDPATLATFQIVRQTPELWHEISPVIKRSDEFKAEAVAVGESQRTFTGLFAGIALSERGGAILDMAIDRDVNRESAKMKEVLKSGDAYAHTLVIGTGPQTAIYNSVKASYDPKHPGLTVDANERVGGQFAQPLDDVWDLNTRTRPTNGEEDENKNLPGLQGSLNNMPRGTLQEADLTYKVYGSQKDLATAIRVNQLLVSHVANTTKLLKIHEVEAPNGEKPGLYNVDLEDTETGERYNVSTDRVILGTGLGTERTGLEEADETTKQILAEELEKIKRGEDAQVYTYGQWAKKAGDVSNPFPLRGKRRVGVVSPMDSGKVSSKFNLGHGGNQRKSVAQLDNVEKLFWIGQKDKTRQDYVSDPTTRIVYMSLGLEMPNGSDPEYNSRVVPMNGRAYRLERHGDDIRVFVKDKSGNEQYADLDELVLATGFVDETDICLPEGRTESELVYDEFGQPIARQMTGTNIFKVGPDAHLPISDMQKSMSPAVKAKGLDTTVAVWATSEHTAELAKMHSAEDRDREFPGDMLSNPDLAKEDKPIELRAKEDGSEASQESFIVARRDLQKGLNPIVTNDDLFKLSVGDLWRDYRFPADMTQIQLQVRQTSSSSEKVEISMSTDSLSMTDLEHARAIDTLFSDPAFLSAVTRMTDKNTSRSQAGSITIPLYDRKIDIGGIKSEVARRR